MDIRGFTVGPVQENAWIARRDGAGRALLIDPGDEAERLQDAVETLGVTVEAILITHCHFDHVGAVAAMARATGAPVHCPAGEVPMLEDINAYLFPGFGPFESYTPERTVSGDVLFQGSIGRTDLPGADHATLMRSIAGLLETLPDETRVIPGHMGTTTLGRERHTNPFLLAAR